MSINIILGEYKFKTYSHLCLNPSFAKTIEISSDSQKHNLACLSLRTGCMMGFIPVFLLEASQGMQRGSKTSKLPIVYPYFNPLKPIFMLF